MVRGLFSVKHTYESRREYRILNSLEPIVVMLLQVNRMTDQSLTSSQVIVFARYTSSLRTLRVRVETLTCQITEDSQNIPYGLFVVGWT